MGIGCGTLSVPPTRIATALLRTSRSGRRQRRGSRSFRTSGAPKAPAALPQPAIRATELRAFMAVWSISLCPSSPLPPFPSSPLPHFPLPLSPLAVLPFVLGSLHLLFCCPHPGPQASMRSSSSASRPWAHSRFMTGHRTQRAQTSWKYAVIRFECLEPLRHRSAGIFATGRHMLAHAATADA